MTFRSRLFAAFTLAAVVPLAFFAWRVRQETTSRLSAEYGARTAALASVVRADAAQAQRRVVARVERIADDLARDSRFRLALLGDRVARSWLIDYAPDAMRTAGLDMLLLQDDSGTVLSSGHFRNEFGRVGPPMPAEALQRGGIIRVRTASGALLALAAATTFTVNGHQFTLAGGIAADSGWLGGLTRVPGFAARLSLPGAAPASAAAGDALVLPFADVSGPTLTTGNAILTVSEPPSALPGLLSAVGRWLLAALALLTLVALVAGAWLAGRLSRPLRRLAEATQALDLDRPDPEFESTRSDEIGVLARRLTDLAGRVRQSAARLVEAERRAATGELARQVNHDIKNGLAPIRNVLAHFNEVASRNPGALPAVFAERRQTLESSIAYLEDLARRYLGPEPSSTGATCALNRLAHEVAAGFGADRVAVEAGKPAPVAIADPVSLRRVLENLVANAIESLAGESGTVVIRTESAGRGGARVVRLTVADSGAGMTGQELNRAFAGHYTTKPGGSGLGLAAVRQMVTELGGTLRVESAPGAGTRVTVELPGTEAG